MSRCFLCITSMFLFQEKLLVILLFEVPVNELAGDASDISLVCQPILNK